jgi:hypothetical protein
MRHFNLAGLATAAVFALGISGAQATIVVDGTLDAAYGAPTSSVSYNAAAPEANFGAPTNESDAIAYDIYMKTDSGNVYLFFQTNPASGGASAGGFANLYFDLDPANGNGSDLGFEVTNGRAFIPGVAGYAAAPLMQFSGDTTHLEVMIPDSYFTAPIAGLSYYPSQQFVSSSDPDLVLRLSQTFGYSVAGGDSYGSDRLGHVTLAVAAPEPATMALFGSSLFGMGWLKRKRRKANA